MLGSERPFLFCSAKSSIELLQNAILVLHQTTAHKQVFDTLTRVNIRSSLHHEVQDRVKSLASITIEEWDIDVLFAVRRRRNRNTERVMISPVTLLAKRLSSPPSTTAHPPVNAIRKFFLKLSSSETLPPSSVMMWSRRNFPNASSRCLRRLALPQAPTRCTYL